MYCVIECKKCMVRYRSTGGQMIVIQKENVMSRSSFVIQMCQLHYHERKFLVSFSGCCVLQQTSVSPYLLARQTIFNISRRVLKHCVGYCNHVFPYAGFRLLKIVVFDRVSEVCPYNSTGKKIAMWLNPVIQEAKELVLSPDLPAIHRVLRVVPHDVQY